MKLAIFDFNGTIFPKETMPFLLSQWMKLGYSKKRFIKVFLPLLPLYLKYKIGASDDDSKEIMEINAVKGVSKLFKDMNKREVEEFFNKAEKEAFEHYNQKVVKEIRNVKEQDYQIVLLSGAFRLFLLQVGKRFGIDTVIGSKLSFNDNKFCFLKKNNIVCGSKKLESLYQKIEESKVDWSQSYAYADSIHDLPLLRKVGKPKVVSPDNKLTKIAQNNNWDIITD